MRELAESAFGFLVAWALFSITTAIGLTIYAVVAAPWPLVFRDFTGYILSIDFAILSVVVSLPSVTLMAYGYHMGKGE